LLGAGVFADRRNVRFYVVVVVDGLNLAELGLKNKNGCKLVGVNFGLNGHAVTSSMLSFSCTIACLRTSDALTGTSLDLNFRSMFF